MYSIEAIGVVRNNRKEPADDFWGGVISEIQISPKISEESILGLEGFSHIEVIYYFHLADPAKIIISATHPREDRNYPRVGIFSQRKKTRPNLIGTSIAELISIEGGALTVKGLDAIDGTPVIDIKPVMREFLPHGEVRQPQWASALMKNYWKVKS